MSKESLIESYREISGLLIAIDNCIKNNNQEWREKHIDSILEIVKNELPSGSGICNLKFDFNSKPDKLIFHFSFHHMYSNGFYSGYTDHTLIIKPSLFFGIDIRITGPDKNDIKDYLYQVFS